MPLSTVGSWAYQLQGITPSSITTLARSAYDLVVIDPVTTIAGQQGFDIAGSVAALKASRGSSGAGKTVLAYVDVGEAESYRTYWTAGWTAGSPDWILGSDPDGWAGNYPVKFWRPEWQSIARAQVAQAMAAGFDGLYLDWLEIYKHPPAVAAARAEGRDIVGDLLGFVRSLAATARAINPNAVLVVQNTADLASNPDYVRLFDAIAQEHVLFNGSPTDPDSGIVKGDVAMPPEDASATTANLASWRAQGRTVLTVDYATTPQNAAIAYGYSAAHGFVPYVATQKLDAPSTTPPPLLSPSGAVSRASLTLPVNGFDAAYYLATNPDVAAAGVDALTHYQNFGWREGRAPDRMFDPKAYLAANPDVAAAGMEPLTHYHLSGWREGRAASPSFDTAAYLRANPDIAAAGVDPLAHYLALGYFEGRHLR